MDKKICVIRVKNGATVMIGGFRKGRLLVLEWKRYAGTINAVGAAILPVINEYKAKGFIVAVDDPYGQLPLASIRASLQDTDANNQPRLILALNAHRHLSDHKAIAFSNCNRIDITDTVTEPVIDGNGKTTFIIDWDVFKEEQLALLLMCYHALYHQPTEVSYLQQYFKHLGNIRQHGSVTSVRGWRS